VSDKLMVQSSELRIAASPGVVGGYDLGNVRLMLTRRPSPPDLVDRLRAAALAGGHSMYDSDSPWNLDTQEDYDSFCQLATMIDCTPPHPTTRELLAFLKEHPELERRE